MAYAATPASLIPRRQVRRSAAARGRLRCRTAALVLSAIGGSLAAQHTCCTIDAPVGPNSTFKTPSTWPNGEVLYTFDSNVTTSQRLATRRAMDELEAAADLRFIETRAYVGKTILRFKNHSSRNYVTYIGRIPSGFFTTTYQPVYIHNWSHGILLHEILHTLGFHHEQNRPDRAKYVRINWNCIKSEWKAQYRRVDGAKTYGPYDFESIMHYPASSSSIGPCRQITVQPAYAHMQNKLGQRSGLSCGDVTGLVGVYGRSKRTVDLGGSRLIATSAAAVGSKLPTPQVLIYNYGTGGRWGTVGFSLYLSRDRRFDKSDVRLGGFQAECVRALPRRTTVVRPTIGSAEIPARVKPGDYWIFAFLSSHDGNRLNDKTPFERIRIWLPGTIRTFGKGCRGSNGLVRHVSRGTAKIGRTQYFDLHRGPRLSASMLYFGFSAAWWNGLRLPLALDSIGATGCRLYTSPAVVLTFPTSSTGSVVVAHRHPNLPVYVGMTFYTQFVSYDRSANRLGLTYSNAVSTRVGSR